MADMRLEHGRVAAVVSPDVIGQPRKADDTTDVRRQNSQDAKLDGCELNPGISPSDTV